jgi:DNA-cytosine methyltransferase
MNDMRKNMNKTNGKTRPLRYLSLFSGIEAVSVALKPMNWKPVAFCENDEFPSAVLKKHYPNVPNLGDITKVDFKPYKGETDAIWGGSPCFPAGTLVMTKERLKPIEDVQVGDYVLTHRNRWRKVLRTGSKIADTIILKGQGIDSIECTPNHPFWSIKKTMQWDNGKRGYDTILSTPEWVEAKDMDHRMWMNTNGATHDGIYAIPDFEDNIENAIIPKISEPFFYFIGRWLGDGWANEHKRKNRKHSIMKRVYVCSGKGKAAELTKRMEETGLHFSSTEMRTSVRFTVSSTVLYDWIVENFGVHADGKNIPSWVFSLPEQYRKALFQGYMDSDGCLYEERYSSVSVNRALTVGMKMLAAGLGYTTSIVKQGPRNLDGTAVIEGRTVHVRPTYTQSYYTTPRSAIRTENGFWGLVRKIMPGHKNTHVYNLEVEDDNSYTADGIAVHNCTSFSLAGKREGLRGESGLMYQYVRAVSEVMPRWVVWENVFGAFSSERGGAFHQLLSSLDELGYGLAWRVLDAKYFGVAQRRRRVFLIGSLGDACAGNVLFDGESLLGGVASGAEAGSSVAGVPGTESASSGGFGAGRSVAGVENGGNSLTPWDGQSQRIYSEFGVFPTLEAKEHTHLNGGQAVIVPVRADGFNAGNGSKAGGVGYEGETAPTLKACESGTNQMPTVVTNDNGETTYVLNMAHTQQNGRDVNREIMGTMVTGTDQAICQPVAFNGKNAATQGMGVDTVSPTLGTTKVPDVWCAASTHSHAEILLDQSPTLLAHNGKEPEYVTVPHDDGVPRDQSVPFGIVRHITPVEAERLQGFPSLLTFEHEQATGSEIIAWALATRQLGIGVDGGIYRVGDGMSVFDEPERVVGADGTLLLRVEGCACPVNAGEIAFVATHPAECWDGVCTDAGADQDGVPFELSVDAVEDYTAYRWPIRLMEDVLRMDWRRVRELVSRCGYTDIPWKGAEHAPNGKRFKALGNSMAVPVMRWIGQRIERVDAGLRATDRPDPVEPGMDYDQDALF